MDLKKKVGPLPLWAWVGLLAGISYIAWRRAKAKSEGESQTGVEEGWEPTQGIPAEGAPTGAGGGVTGAEEFLQHSQEAVEGRQLAAQEAAEGREIGHEEAVENRTVAREEASEGRTFSLEEQRQRLAEWMAGVGRGAKSKSKAGHAKSGTKKPSASHKQGKGGQGKRAHEKGNGNAGQKHHAAHNNHQPGHHAKTDHRPAAPARTRLKAGRR